MWQRDKLAICMAAADMAKFLIYYRCLFYTPERFSSQFLTMAGRNISSRIKKKLQAIMGIERLRLLFVATIDPPTCVLCHLFSNLISQLVIVLGFFFSSALAATAGIYSAFFC